MTERFVIVHRSFDPVQAEMLGDVLRDAGLAARVIGTRSGAAIGVGQVIMQVNLEVPETQAGEATDFLEAFLAGDGAASLRAEGELADDDDEAAPTETARRPLLAIGVALLMPFGGGHAYARRPWTALAILAGQAVGFGMMVQGASVSNGFHKLATGATLFCFLVLCDAIGAVAAIRRSTPPPTHWRQLVPAAAFVALGLGAGKLVAEHAPRKGFLMHVRSWGWADPLGLREPGLPADPAFDLAFPALPDLELPDPR